MPKLANGIYLDADLARAHSENVEGEVHGDLLPDPEDAVRVLGYENHANMGNYRQAIDNFNAATCPSNIINPRARHAEIWFRNKPAEQNLSPSYVAFARWGWNNGRTESFAYTEVDSTVLAGLGVYGAKWHRRQDRAGIAFVSNGICQDHQTYLGMRARASPPRGRRVDLRPRKYLGSLTPNTAHVWRGSMLPPGDSINNPDTTEDRGPVTVPNSRAHVEL